MKTQAEHLRLPRSPMWEALRDQWIADHPRCASCGSSKSLEVHHKVPVHVSRSLELDPKNLITLCQDPKNPANQCHLNLGHLGNWYNWNRNIDKQASDALLRMYPKDGKPGPAEPKSYHPTTTPPALPVAPVTNPAAAAPGDAPATLETQPVKGFRRSRRA